MNNFAVFQNEIKETKFDIFKFEKVAIFKIMATLP